MPVGGGAAVLTRFVLLLRGVNVGKARRVPMAELRTLLSDLGYTQVATLLNSGNAVFSAPSGQPDHHATAIARGLVQRLSLEVPVIVKTARSLATIVADKPAVMDGADPSRLLVAFAPTDAALAALAALSPLVAPPEQFVLGTHAAYLHCANGILDSPAGAALVGKLGRSATSRNWATVLKLQALTNAA